TLDERLWLDEYFDAWYFWTKLAPDPDPWRDRSLSEYFEASLYTGGDARFPRDRWSYMESSSDFDRFFGEGRTLGYGVYLAGIETQGDPTRPLRVRWVAPHSEAALQGVQRGDEIVMVDGRAAAQLVAADDYGVFTPDREGRTLALVLRRGGTERSLTLRATVYALEPVTLTRVLSSMQGRRMGYLHVKDMIAQGEKALDDAFASLRAAGISELAIDLRYNGGGLVSTARRLASYVSGDRTRDQVFARLLYNDRRASAENEALRFERRDRALALSRVYVLAGPRTCSASELVVNGLRPFVEVVTVGAASCGKPVGFRPVSRCDTTFSVVNFEGVNALDQGRYFDGIAATCPVEEDFSVPLGEASEPLLATALAHADSGRCTAAGAGQRRPQQARGPGHRGGEPPERQGMWMR
ncbi:MAG: peptidase S41, partial [Rubrivivax sp.]|nr:peptidase S41 [Rubrivivax sp.]